VHWQSEVGRLLHSMFSIQWYQNAVQFPKDVLALVTIFRSATF